MPNIDAEEWERICRIEAAWTLHAPTRALLLELAAEYGILASGTEAAESVLQDEVTEQSLPRTARRANG